VAAAREQAQERGLERLVAQVERRDVPLQVVDGNEGQAVRPGDRLGGGESDEERPDEAGAACDRDAIDRRELDACLAKRLANDRRDELEMAARRDLGDDAPVASVQLVLRGDDGREHPAVARHHRGGGLVAGRLDSENHSVDVSAVCSASLHMINQRLSVVSVVTTPDAADASQAS
jgi:hypothetical protein